MNTFNESNTIEAMLIEAAQKAGWDYVPIADVPRNESQILVEPWLVEALRRLNPALTPAQIDEVVIPEIDAYRIADVNVKQLTKLFGDDDLGDGESAIPQVAL